jgi:hypothetical protein
MVGATKHRTKSDDDRFDAIQSIGCICCCLENWPGTPCEIDHLLTGGVRFEDEHRYTIGLDSWHHRGIPPPHCCGSIEEATKCHGPSRRHNSKAFAERYGTDDQLLAIEDAAIRIVQSARRRGEYLPAREIGKAVRELHREIVGEKA